LVKYSLSSFLIGLIFDSLVTALLSTASNVLMCLKSSSGVHRWAEIDSIIITMLIKIIVLIEKYEFIKNSLSEKKMIIIL